MFVPRPDQPLDDADCWDFVRTQGFGHLIAPGAGRDLPVVTATQYAVDGEQVVLHLATPNRIWAALTERPRALLSVAGDWAYIPSDWNADGDPRLGIPTTYYAAVQLEADVEIHDADEEKLTVLRTQLAALQPETDAADPGAHQSRLSGIRGITLTVTAVRGKFKYGGNRPVEHRENVAEHLRERGTPGDLAARQHVLRRSRL